MMLRIGLGYDIHRLSGGRALLLGGIKIESPIGEVGHSDGDVLIHAIIDAFFGAVAMGDIGTHFPPTSPQYKDIDSKILLKKCLGMITRTGWYPINIDSTVILEKPMLKSYIYEIRRSIALLCNLEIESVSVKAKTKEGLGEVGSGLAIESHCNVLLGRHDI